MIRVDWVFGYHPLLDGIGVIMTEFWEGSDAKT